MEASPRQMFCIETNTVIQWAHLNGITNNVFNWLIGSNLAWMISPNVTHSYLWSFNYYETVN